MIARKAIASNSTRTLPGGTSKRTGKSETTAVGSARGQPPRHRETLAAQSTQTALPLPVVIFLAGLIIPWIIPLGPLNLSVYRIVLLVMLLPCLVMWLSGKVGPIRVADIAVILFSFWASISLAIVHGFEPMIEAIGINNVETLGAYMLARCYIRTENDFHNMVRVACKLVMILLPFSLYEWFTGQKPLLTIFGLVFPTSEISMIDGRWGLTRVQGPFGHPILYGVFCGSVVGLAYSVLGYRESALARWRKTALISLASFMSMSSAPLAGMVLQFAVIAWNSLLKRFEWRWKILWAIIFIAYLVVEVGSNQTPVSFYISHFTFDAQTGWYRLAIWECGSATVANHPWFGIGYGVWEERLSWMGDSVDNFWLVMAMRHGLPAVIFIFGACMAVVLSAAFKQGLDEKADTYRTAYVICMVVFVVVGFTVHFWAAAYAWFMFMLGSGIWILEQKANAYTASKRQRGALVLESAEGPMPAVFSRPTGVQVGSSEGRTGQLSSRRRDT